MLLSLVLLGAYIGMNDGMTLGPVGGIVMAVVLASGVATAGLAPHWIYAILVMLIGFVLAAVAIRAFR
jgi:hypothetical protein